jgi:tetratricopeptide (TPR) repeat protein
MKTLILLFLFSVPSISFGNFLTLKSNPTRADVFVINTTTNKRVKIGRTPFEIKMQEVVTNFSESQVFLIEVVKGGYEDYRVMVGQVGSNEVDLTVNLNPVKTILEQKNTDELIAQLFDIQRQIRTKDYENAIGRLMELDSKFPNYSIISELIGSAYYLDQKFKEALSYYRKAFSINPENKDAFIMKNYLEKKFNLTALKES